MTPEQALNLIQTSIRNAVESVPRSYIDLEPEKAWSDITARFTLELLNQGFELAPAQKRAQKRVHRRAGPKRCEATMPGADQCVLNAGHKGQHCLSTGNRWG